MDQNAPTVSDILAGGSSPTATWDARPPHNIPIGFHYAGKVVREEVTQQTEPTGPGEPVSYKFWDKERTRPKMQIIVTLQNDFYITEDNAEGHMRVFLKAGALQAAQAAARAHGVDTFMHHEFLIRWVGETPPKNPAFNPTKNFEVELKLGTAPAVASMVTGAGEGGWAAPAAPAAPVAAAPVAAAPVAAAAPPVAAAPAAPVAAAPVAAAAPPVAAAPAEPAPSTAVADLSSILGATEIVTPLDPATADQVRKVHAAGYKTTDSIVQAFGERGITLTGPQVEQALGGTPV